jgi:hypothetical protein
MSFVWRTGTGETHAPLSTHAVLGPRIAITCQVALGFVYFVLVLRTFRNYSEVGRKARVVQRLADEQIELETTRPEWMRGRENVRTNWRAAPRAEEDGATTREGGRGRSRASDGVVEEKARPPGNELGLSGMDRKREATVGHGGDPANDSYSSIGM